MQTWQIKALELEASGLKHLDGFVHEHTFYVLITAIYLLLSLLVCVLSGVLRRKGGKSSSYIRPVIFIQLPGLPPRPPDTFNQFPPPHHSAHCDHDDDWE